MPKQKKRGKRLLAVLGAILLFLLALFLFLQHVWPHRSSPFLPDYPKLELSSLLAQETLSPEDYQTLYAQTGLGPAAIDDLLARGEAGARQILDTQERFFSPPGDAPCRAMGFVTYEHRYRDDTGRILFGVPLAPLREGDIIVSLSTHTLGWRHGHAGLVLDPEAGITLESVVLGSDSAQMDAQHWRSYSTLLVLRPKNVTDDQRHAVVEFAREHLDGIPYSLLSGIFGPKFQPVDSAHNAQCAYLPWYAWMSQGVDLDGDGGTVVTPMDLTLGQVEIVQLCGIDPADYPLFPGK